MFWCFAQQAYYMLIKWLDVMASIILLLKMIFFYYYFNFLSLCAEHQFSNKINKWIKILLTLNYSDQISLQQEHANCSLRQEWVVWALSNSQNTPRYLWLVSWSRVVPRQPSESSSRPVTPLVRQRVVPRLQQSKYSSRPVTPLVRQRVVPRLQQSKFSSRPVTPLVR